MSLNHQLKSLTRILGNPKDIISKPTELWMCGASEDGIDEEDMKPKIDKDYILEPFPNDQFILDTCQDVLATVDVCVNEVTQTVFYDKEWFDIIPIQMVRVIHGEPAG